MRKAAILKYFFFLLLLLGSTGCAGLIEVLIGDRKTDFREDLRTIQSDDFAQHLSSLGEIYVNSPGISVVRLNNRARRYLESVFHNIVENNELLLDFNGSPAFHIISSSTPFFFSLPNGKFYFSTGLIDKYLRSEELFVSMLTHEIIKSLREIYNARVVVPIGHISTERMLQITRVDFETKAEINKWAYFALNRSGYDASAYLSWLQIQNKNTFDFTFQLGDIRTISREEYVFKNFVASDEGRLDLNQRSSNLSAEFYFFLNYIRRFI